MIVIDALYRLERELSTNHRRGGLVGTGGASDAPRSTIGAVSINPYEIRGGGANSLMAEVTVKYSTHFSSTYTPEEMVELIRDTVRGAAMTDLWLRENPPVVEISDINDGFCTDRNHPAVGLVRRAHAQIHGKENVAQAWVAGCDADVISKYAPCVVYGPTGAGAHAGNERSRLQDIVDAAKVYALTAMEFCE
jgi:acetylornithine deacetylase